MNYILWIQQKFNKNIFVFDIIFLLINIRKECKFLEKNYLECLLQKGLKDRVEAPKCNLEYAWYFHVECPDYIKKYDHPVEGKKYLKQQLYNMLALPYYNYKQKETNSVSAEDTMPTLKSANSKIQYSELNAKKNMTNSFNLLLDSQLKNDFSEGVEFKADEQPSKPEESSDE